MRIKLPFSKFILVDAESYKFYKERCELLSTLVEKQKNLLESNERMITLHKGMQDAQDKLAENQAKQIEHLRNACTAYEVIIANLEKQNGK